MVMAGHYQEAFDKLKQDVALDLYCSCHISKNLSRSIQVS